MAPPATWTVQPLTPEYFDEARELLVDTFIDREPGTKTLGAPRRDVDSDVFPTEETKSLLQHSLSVVALTESNQLIGVYFVDGEFSPPTEATAPQSLKPLFALFDGLVSSIDMSEFLSDSPNKLAYGVAVAVREGWGGVGIGKALMAESLRLSHEHGFKFRFELVTSKYSQQIALKSGFQLKAFKNYREFEYNGQKPFKNMDPEHEGVGLAVLDLDKYQDYNNL